MYIHSKSAVIRLIILE